MKYVVIVPDGMADEPIERLGGRTPLEAARTPFMDLLGRQGRVGMVQTIPAGMPPGSDVGNLSVMGYDPAKVLTGRAPLEAANLGITLEDDEVAFRCNLVTTRDGRMVDYSAGHISTAEAGILIRDLQAACEGTEARFVTGKGYRHLLILKARHPRDLLQVRCTPPHDIMGERLVPHLPAGKAAPVLLRLMEKSGKIFSDHPTNQVRVDLRENPATMIWLWGQGDRPRLPTFREKYGVDGAIISAVDLVNGIGRLAGLEVIRVPGATGYYDTDYRGKADHAVAALDRVDFVYIHVEAPDEAGHNGDAKAKTQAIEDVDRHIVGPVFEHLRRKEGRILVLPDHPTPVRRRSHTRAPVGFVMWGAGIRPDGTPSFSETTAKRKGIAFGNGEALMAAFIGQGGEGRR